MAITEEVRIDEISLHPRNPKIHSDKQITKIEKSIKRFGWTEDVILSSDNVCLAGHARIKAAINLGWDTIPCKRTKLTGAEADAYLIADNRLSDLAPYDRDILAELLSDLPKDLAELTGFDSVQVEALLSGEDIPDIEKFIRDSQPEEPREEVDAEPLKGNLSARFGVPPFSVLNAREGWWQDRKRAWIALGIKSELGRGGDNASPGRSPRPACDYSRRERGDGYGRAL